MMIIRSQLLRYGVAILAVAQVLIIKLLLAPKIGEETPFLLFFTAVMVSAGYGGTGPGILAITLVALASNYFFLPPVYSFSLDLDGLLKIGVFILEGLLITSVIVALNAARQRTEENALKVQRQQESLHKTEERYRLLVEGVKDYAIFMLDPNGGIVNWNAGAERIHGYQTEEIIGQPFFIFYSKEDQTSNLPAYELKIACQEEYFEGTGWHVRKDGTGFWADVVITALKDETGNLQGFSKVTRDITERKQLEDALCQRAGKLEQVNLIKDEFLATLSHELRTPLNSVLGWAQLLRTRKLNEDKIACGLETIERNAKSQVQLIEDLLDVSSMIKGKLRLNVLRVDLVPLIEAAIATVRPAADAKALNLIFSIADCELGNLGQEQETVEFVKSNGQLNNLKSKSLISVSPAKCKPQQAAQNPRFSIMGDPDRIHQVLWNLLSNAVKFTPKEGRVEVRLSVVNQQEGSELNSESTTQNSFAQIQVIDTGQGISRDLLPYVFNRFYQADSTSTRLHEGLGLGLAIARHLVELHGGTIHADSQGDRQGAIFTVNLPCLTAVVNH
jgi:PAS domain S-box-containing protein